MHIVIATGLYPPESGGPATYSKALEEALPKEGIEVTIVPFSNVRTYPKLLRHFLYFWKVFRVARGRDIVYALDPVSVGLPAWCAAFFRRKKFVVRIAGDYAWEQGVQRFGVKENLDEFVVKKNYAWPVRVLRKMQTFVARRAIKIVVPSEYLKKIVVTWGIEEGKIEVIYNAIEKIILSETKEELKKRYGCSKHSLVSVGRLVPWKGFECLVSLMPKLQEKFPDIELRIIGDGPDYDKLQEQIRNLHLEDRVFLLGRKEKQELYQIIAASDIFVLNTGYEGLSHQLLEVMQLDVPLITTSVGGNIELVKDGESGILVGYNSSDEMYQAIVRYFEDQELQKRVVEGARKEIGEKFSYEVFLKKTVEFLRSL